MEEKKFVCKFCNKKFPCGKSLGGHIRIHMNEYSAQRNGKKGRANLVKLASFDGGRKRKRDSAASEAATDVPSAGVNYVYGLRENRKRTMRFADSSATASDAKFCKECGKGFASLKALCGHMACHSEKERGFNKLDENSGLKDEVVMDNQSDTEASTPSHPKRSMRMRLEPLNAQSSSSLANNSSFTESEQEQEEGARCLLLLSKDSGYRGGLNSTADSSETNSVVLEVKSPCTDTKMGGRHEKEAMSNGSLLRQINRRSGVAETAVSNDSNSQYFLSGCNKDDSEISVDGYPKNGDLKKLKVEKSGVQHYIIESGQGGNITRGQHYESSRILFKDLEFDRREGTMEYNLRKEEKTYSFRSHVNIQRKKTVSGLNSEVHGRLTSKIVKRCYDPTYESTDQSTDSDSLSVPVHRGSKHLKQKLLSNSEKKKKKLGSKKSKGHECPICYKIFRSGQALGGHKRSHFIGGSEENATLVIKPDASHVQCLIDLNLPATFDE